MNTRKFIGTLALLPALVANAQMVPEIKQVAYDNPPLSHAPIILTNKEKEALRLVREWRKNPDKPTRTEDGGIMYLYGATLPTLICAPLKVCAIRLAPGEIVDEVHTGDSMRWKVAPAKMGNITHVIVKPTESGLTTNTIITTNFRSYTVLLKSARQEFTPYISFHYPEETDRMWNDYREAYSRSVKATTLVTGENVASLNFNYRMEGDNPRWKPQRVYNDGEKTYIQFPSSNFTHEIPVLVTMGEKSGLFSDAKYEMVNYRLIGDRFVVDKILDSAFLISGVGKNEVKIAIEYTGDTK